MYTYNARPQAGWRLIEPATLEAIDVTAAKLHLNLTHTADDTLVDLLIQCATGYVEERGFALMPQTWEYVLDEFPCGPIELYKRPIQSVESIQYVDSDGDTQTWDSAEYQVALAADPPRIAPAYGFSWPSTRAQMEAVTIRMTAGYNDSPVQLPALIHQAMLLLIGHLYTNREAVIVLQGVVSLELPLGVETLLDSILRKARVH